MGKHLSLSVVRDKFNADTKFYGNGAQTTISYTPPRVKSFFSDYMSNIQAYNGFTVFNYNDPSYAYADTVVVTQSTAAILASTNV